MPDRTCTDSNCTRPAKVIGLCGMHYQRQYKATRVDPCSITGCDRTTFTKAMCVLHYNRMREHGDPLYERPRKHERRERRSVPVTYTTLHKRIRAQRGPATDHLCVDCGAQALEWSYSFNEERPLISAERGREGKPYSLDVQAYEARCKACHKAFDMFITGNLR
ncbi:MAG: hypothetical protein HIU88_10195 [Acidobacteria bacterium]|nr:hypothetical protein [Acidobacteriota bacterium]